MQARLYFKQRLHKRDPLLGFFISLPSPALVEMIAYAGFDFVIIDNEHGPMSVETIEHMVRAAEAAGIAALVRLPNPSYITQILDLGAAGIVVPHISTVEEAKAIVESAYFPPLGHRGVTTLSRAARHGFVPSAQYLANRADDTTVIVIIEDVAAIPHVADIAALEGIDGLFVGPSDLSSSLNLPGQPGHPDVVAAITAIRDAVLPVANVGLGTTGRVSSEIGKQLETGFNFIGFSTPLVIGTALRDLMNVLKPQIKTRP